VYVRQCVLRDPVENESQQVHVHAKRVDRTNYFALKYAIETGRPSLTCKAMRNLTLWECAAARKAPPAKTSRTCTSSFEAYLKGLSNGQLAQGSPFLSKSICLKRKPHPAFRATHGWRLTTRACGPRAEASHLHRGSMCCHAPSKLLASSSAPASPPLAFTHTPFTLHGSTMLVAPVVITSHRPRLGLLVLTIVLMEPYHY